MDDWMPLEIVVLVAVAAVAAVSLCALLAWYRLRHRQIELAACTSDDQAARLLAESLAKVGATADSVEEIMTTFVRWIRPANAPWRQQSLDSSQRPTRCSGRRWTKRSRVLFAASRRGAKAVCEPGETTIFGIGSTPGNAVPPR